MNVAMIEMTDGARITVSDPRLDFDFLLDTVREGGWLTIGE